MNRQEKEEKRKYAEARAGLTESEIEELDAKEAAAAVLEEQARELHFALFPEEWDFYNDSMSEANDRKRGINPMSAEYISKTDSRRVELGFAAYMDDASHPNDTIDWVRKKLREGQQNELIAILERRKEEDSAEAEAMAEQVPVQTGFENVAIDAATKVLSQSEIKIDELDALHQKLETSWDGDTFTGERLIFLSKDVEGVSDSELEDKVTASPSIKVDYLELIDRGEDGYTVCHF